MAIYGAGAVPIGTGPGGIGTTGEAIAPAEAPPTFSRAFDGSTRDYILLPSRVFALWPRVRQQVAIALMTAKGSVAGEPTFGVQLPTKISGSFSGEVDAEVRRALRHIRECDVTSVDVIRDGATRTRVRVEYTDRTSGNADHVEVTT
jgi:phage baseplate assembly protein W